MKILGLKQPIPKHLYEQAEAADLGRPDFYVGPTVATKSRPASTSTEDDSRDLETRMSEAKKASEKEAGENGNGSVVSLLVRFFQRPRLRRARAAR